MSNWTAAKRMAEVYREALMPRRWLIILVLGVSYLLALMVAGTLLMRILVSESFHEAAPIRVLGDVGEALVEPRWWLWVGLLAVAFVALQLLFVLPLLARTPPMGKRPRRLVLSLLIAIGISGAMLGTFAAALAELARLYMSSVISEELIAVILIAFFAVSWALWSFILFVFTRGLWPDKAIARMIGLLLGGTIVETITVIPIDLMIRRKTDCYCFSGSYLSLCLAGFVLMWLAGPGFVLALTARKHRLWRERHCARCGYAKGPSPGDRCPECGFAWIDSDERGEGASHRG
jgi:hypothetical protein